MKEKGKKGREEKGRVWSLDVSGTNSDVSYTWGLYLPNHSPFLLISNRYMQTASPSSQPQLHAGLGNKKVTRNTGEEISCGFCIFNTVVTRKGQNDLQYSTSTVLITFTLSPFLAYITHIDTLLVLSLLLLAMWEKKVSEGFYLNELSKATLLSRLVKQFLMYPVCVPIIHTW